MKFGIVIHARTPHVAADAREAEERGFDSIWCPELPNGQGDVFSCMAVAATATSRIGIGSLVAAASMRTPLATANAAATINALAPGRTFLGIGNGSVSRSFFGQPSISISAFREHLEIVCAMLREGEAEVPGRHGRSTARFVFREEQYLRLEPRIPVYPTAYGPRGLELVGKFGDGICAAGPADVETVATLYRTAVATRGSSENFPFVYCAPVCVLRDGETLRSPRVIDRAGQMVSILINLCLAGAISEQTLLPGLRPAYEKAAKRVAGFSPAERTLALFQAPYTLAPHERELVTPEAIEAVAAVGDRSEVLARLKALEEVGVTEFLMDTSVRFVPRGHARDQRGNPRPALDQRMTDARPTIDVHRLPRDESPVIREQKQWTAATSSGVPVRFIGMPAR